MSRHWESAGCEFRTIESEYVAASNECAGRGAKAQNEESQRLIAGTGKTRGENIGVDEFVAGFDIDGARAEAREFGLDRPLVPRQIGDQIKAGEEWVRDGGV